MQPSTSSDSSSDERICEGLKDELLDGLDKARNLDDLVKSLRAQKLIIEVLLELLLP